MAAKSRLMVGLFNTSKATPNKLPVCRPDFRHICMWAGGPFFIISLLPGIAIIHHVSSLLS